MTIPEQIMVYAIRLGWRWHSGVLDHIKVYHPAHKIGFTGPDAWRNAARYSTGH